MKWFRVLWIAASLQACTLNVGDYSVERQAVEQSTNWTTLQVDLDDRFEGVSFQPASSLFVEAQARVSAIGPARDNGLMSALEQIAMRFVPEINSVLRLELQNLPSYEASLFVGTLAVTLPAGKSVSVTASNSDVDARGVSGNVKVRTSNGNVEFETPLAVDVQTSNGGVDGSAGSGTVDTSNGEVTVRWGVQGPLTLSTSNGSVKVTVPRGAGISLAADTSNGSIRVNGREVDGPQDAFINGGGTRLELHTSNGSVEIQESN